MKILFAAILIGGIGSIGLGTALAQTTIPANERTLNIYRETPPKYNDLVHTKLEVRFDYKKRLMFGKEWATFKPYFYPTDSLRLDAQGMDIKSVTIVKAGKNIPLKFTYDSLTINIKLDRSYRNSERYTVYLDYTAKPNQLKARGSAAITDAKGLYFINPDGTEKDKPTQIWTQGETQSSSAWFPTIDRPNQKTTSEISMTVPAKYVTLSNGRLASQKVNGDGTRTDTWKQELPHAPYLFMMAVGDFKITKDTWKGKEVSYYLEPKYAPYARDIFGFTPEVIDFFSKILGVDYPWNKYAQIVVRDYVSGAMENTSATLHGDYVQATQRELIDAYYSAGRSTIVHELFHQWFGDYVTAESWSNLTVNESFADFSETLWAEYKYGKDAGDAHMNDDRQSYLNQPELKTKDLVRFHYKDKEEVFDAVTYQKGGSILYMLRNFLGNAAFYKGLNIYLKTNAFKNAEAQHLRLAMEEASGRDLNWFFNQWYFGAGHPVLNITYKWDDTSKKQTVYFQQTQEGNAFILPLAIDVYADGKMDRHEYWIRHKVDSVVIQSAVKPSLVNVDGDKMLLVKKTDAKTLDEFVFQYFNTPLFLDRFEAITAAAKQQGIAGARKVMIAALNDKYYQLQIKAILAADMNNNDVRNAVESILPKLAETDPSTLVRAAAITALGKLKEPRYIDIFKQAVKSQSYAVTEAALMALALIDPTEAIEVAKKFERESNGLKQATLMTYAIAGKDDQWPIVYKAFLSGQPQLQFDLIWKLADMISRLSSPKYVKQGVESIIEFGNTYKMYGVGARVVTILTNIKAIREKAGDSSLNATIEKAITELNAPGTH
jgi:aminopeptidase N